MDDKILKNTTVSDIVLKAVGFTVPASGQLLIEKTQYDLFSSDDSISEISTYISSGDIVVNNGTYDLSATIGLNYMRMSDHGKNVLHDNDVNLNTMTTITLQDFIDDIASPDVSSKPTYLANGEIDFIEYFKGPTQITSNRRTKVTIAYDANLDPLTETWLLYDTDGTTVLKTVVVTYTFVGTDFTKSERVTT